MSEQLREALSAVLDGEADEFTLRRVLDETSRNVELRDTWTRYSLIKATLRGDADAAVLASSLALRRRVREALAVDEPALVSDPAAPAPLPARSGRSTSRWSVAIAATVMLGAGIAVYFSGVAPSTTTPSLAVVERPVVPLFDGPASQRVSSGNGVAELQRDEALRRHEAYLRMHLRQAAASGYGPVAATRMLALPASESSQLRDEVAPR
ncbi:MAG: sigma-E factor negative regulatory protein [Pseudomonadales bacterium]